MYAGAALSFGLIRACRSGLVLYCSVLSDAGGENDGSSAIFERSLLSHSVIYIIKKILAQSLIIRFLKPLKAKCPNECKISFSWEVRITMNLLWLSNTSKFGINLRIQLYIVSRSMSWKSHRVIKCISSSIAFCEQYLHILFACWYWRVRMSTSFYG